MTHQKPAKGPVIIVSKGDFVGIAREFLRGLPSKRLTHQGVAYEHDGRCYAEVGKSDLEAAIWTFLSKAREAESGDRFRPSRHIVANVQAAADALTNQPASLNPPCWLNGRDELPANEFLSCLNGRLHLPSRMMFPHDPDFFNLHSLVYDFDPAAPPPTTWEKFLASTWPDDLESQECLAEIFGYIIVGATDLQKAFLLIGAKRSGKGTICRILQTLVGRESTCGPTLSSLAGDFGLQHLIGKILAIISDARLGSRVDKSAVAERMLAITGEDLISAPRKFRDDWTGKIQVRFVMLSNEVPRLTDVSGALPSRCLTLHMPKSFYGKEDPALTSKLLQELPGILNWSLDGYARLRKRGYFLQPEAGKAVLEELEELASPIMQFIREKCRVEPGASIPTTSLYEAWREWCGGQGRDHTGTLQTFGRDIKAALPEVRTKQVMQDRDRFRVYEGIALGGLHAVTREEVHCSVHKNEDLYRDSGEHNAITRVKSSETEVLI